MPGYILALDQGTTSSRAILFDDRQNIRAIAQKEFTQIYPAAGYVEHDAEEIYGSQMEVLGRVLRESGVSAGEIAGIGITNQRETTILWDRKTGRPIHNAIVWQCRRTAPQCEQMIADGCEDYIRENTGLRIDAYFSATKIKWLLDNIPGARERAKRGELLFGTVDTWLLWRMTGGRVHATDYTNASRTMLFNLRTMDWDDNILYELDIPRCLLPQVFPSAHLYGTTRIEGRDIPLAAAAGDQQAALFGQCCFEAGDVKNTYGTGCFLLMNTGDKAVDSQQGLLTTIAIGLDGKVSYALEGSVFVAGAAIKWLRDEMKLIDSAADTERIALSVSDSNGVYVVPAFTGLGAPYWDAYARGAVFGLTRGTNKAHFVRATVESLAYETSDVLAAMEMDAGLSITSLRVDGGASANNFLMQFQADIENAEIVRPVITETTALGAAYLAGLAVGYYDSLDEIKGYWKADRRFEPGITEDKRETLLAGWKDAVERTRVTR